MTEQESAKELPIQFPEISKEVLDRLIEEYWDRRTPEKFKHIRAVFEQEDPYLLYFVVRCASVAGDRADRAKFFMGSLLMYKVLKVLAEEGHQLPPWSEEMMEAFLKEKPNMGAPYDYARENPSLMVFLASLDSSVQMGGVLVYQLKRRQFFANQLKKQLGES
jgi:hypothetical protein